MNITCSANDLGSWTWKVKDTVGSLCHSLLHWCSVCITFSLKEQMLRHCNKIRRFIWTYRAPHGKLKRFHSKDWFGLQFAVWWSMNGYCEHLTALACYDWWVFRAWVCNAMRLTLYSLCLPLLPTFCWLVESMPIPKMGTYGRASDTIAENNEERTEFVRTTWSEAYYTKLRTFSKYMLLLLLSIRWASNPIRSICHNFQGVMYNLNVPSKY